FDRPLRDRLVELSAVLQQVFADRGVERQLHLVDRHAVGREIDRAFYAVRPVGGGFAGPGSREGDIDLRKLEVPWLLLDLPDLRRTVSPAVELENPIVVVLDPEAQSGHANAPDGREL